MAVDAGTPKASLSARVASGVAWSAASRVALQLVSIVSAAVVARRLDPSAYGLVNMALIVIGLMAILRDIGIASAVVQRRDCSDRFLSSMFWINGVLGVIATIACFVTANAVAAFYRTPEIAAILRVLSVSFVITNISTIHAALLNRQMSFRKIAIAEIFAAAAGLATAVLMAYSGKGVWSLVVASLVNATIGTILFIGLAAWRPRLHFAWADVRSMSNFGLNITAFNLVNYFARNADNLLIGRYLGVTLLGYYQFAYTLMLYPVQSISQLLGRVLFPAFSEIQDDDSRFRHAYLRACAGIAVVTFPMMAGLAIVSHEFIEVLLGTKWLPVATVVTILAPVGMLQSITTTVGQIYIAKGRTDLMFRWGALFCTLITASFLCGLPWGIHGVAVAYAVAIGILCIPTFVIPFRLVNLSLMDLYRTLFEILCAVVVMAICTGTVRLLLRGAGSSAVVTLAGSVATGVAVYAGMILILNPPFLADLLRMFRFLVRPASSASQQA